MDTVHVPVCACARACVRLTVPARPERPGGLHGSGQGGAGAGQHSAVDVCRHHQDAQQDGPDDGALQAQVVGPAGHRQASQVGVPAPGGEEETSQEMQATRGQRRGGWEV